MTETLDAAGILPEESCASTGCGCGSSTRGRRGAATVVHLHGRGEFVEKYGRPSAT